MPARRTPRRTRVVLLALALVAVLATALALTGCNGCEQTPPKEPTSTPDPRTRTTTRAPAPSDFSENDQVAIYTAVIVEACNLRGGPQGAKSKTPIYLVGETNDSSAEPGTEPASVPIPDSVRKGISERLAELATNVTWVDDGKQVPHDSRGGVKDFGIIVGVGNIKARGRDTVHVGYGTFMAPLAGRGQVLILTRDGGAWRVTGDTGIGWIS